MKIFLSWSGHKSHEVAMALKDWLPSVIQSIEPYVSSEDIDKGARWSTDIAKELANSSFGILCVTKDNIEAPWLLFEAGSLANKVDKGLVCPFLFDLKMAEIKEGPLLQFQTTVFEKDDVRKLLLSINKACGEAGLKEDLLEKSFEIWWPELEKILNRINEQSSDNDSSDGDSDNKSPLEHGCNSMLEEILELSRINQKLLRSPEILFPEGYLKSILGEKDHCDRLDEILVFCRRREDMIDKMEDILETIKIASSQRDRIDDILREMRMTNHREMFLLT